MTVVVWLAVHLAYLIGGLLVLLMLGAVLHRQVVEPYIDRHVRRALGGTVVPFRQPTHVRRVGGRVSVPRRFG